MLQNWSDPKVLEKLQAQSDAELQPDSIQKFIGAGVAGAGLGAAISGTGITIFECTATASMGASAGGLAFGVAALSISAGLVVIAAGYFAYQSNWDYETRIVMLKEKMTKDFDNSLKPQVIVNYMKIYDNMVMDCEKHNKFIE